MLKYLDISRRLEQTLCAGLLVLLASSAHAQADQAAPAPGSSGQADAASLEEVTVTASRVKRTGFTAATPTTVIGADQIALQGATNVADLIDQLPSIKASVNSQTNGVRSITDGATYADLRGLGAIRTLVLVDGTRFVPQVATGIDSYQVDLNQIPALLIDRTEVVTGGASAQWGSDAVGGVVNILLKKNFEGLATDFGGGESAAGDDRDLHAGLLAGRNLFDGRGHVQVALDYERNGGVGDVYTRSWGREGWQVVSNPSPATNHQPAQLILPNVQFSTATPGGIINNTALKGTQFGPGGVPYPFQYGAFVGSSNMVGGGQPGIDISNGASIKPWLRRLNLYGLTSYDLTDSVTASVEASYSLVEAGAQTLPARDTVTSPARITSDNAFLPPSIAAQMVNPVTHQVLIPSFNLGRVNYDMGNAYSDVTNRTRRVVLAFNGTIFGDYTWDAHYGYGQNKNVGYTFNDRIRSKYALATDAVVVTPANVGNSGLAIGQIACRSTLTNPRNGCVPLDLFGAGAPSPDAIRYVLGTEWAQTDYTQQTLAFNIQGEPFSTWAGKVSIASGLEYRDEEQVSNTDPTAQAADYETVNSEPLYGTFNVREAYLETVVPLLNDMPLAKSLDFNGAVRVSHYSTAAGTQPTWKLGLTYTPVQGILLRAGLSQDIRAPNLFELDSSGIVTNQVVTVGTAQSNAFVTTSGNPTLQPETARTVTAGISFQPQAGRGPQLSVDYYDINLTKAIATSNAQQVANFCQAGQTFYCSLITFTNGLATAIRAPYLNFGGVDINGFDMAAAYAIPLDQLVGGVPGELRTDFSGNYVLHSWVNTGAGATIDRAGELGPNNAFSLPTFNMTTSVGYALGGASLTAQLRYIDSGNYDNTLVSGVSINNNHIPSMLYVNLYLSDKVTDHVEVYGSVTNLFNRDPPPAPFAIGYPTNPIYYDMIGTDFRLGFRLKF